MYLHVIQAYTPAANAFAGVTHSPWINAGIYQEIAFIISKGEGEGTMAITIERASDKSGADAETIGFRFSKLKKQPSDMPVNPPLNVQARGVSTSPAAHETLFVSVNNTIGTKPWIRLSIKELQAVPVCGSVIALALKGRYGSMATAL